MVLVKKKGSNLLKREHGVTLGALCDVLAMKWFRVRGWDIYWEIMLLVGGPHEGR